MSKFGFTLLVLSLGTLPSLVLGAAVDTITITPTGANTAFAIAGTFPSNFPTTPYSAPSTSYTLTFTVPTSPTSFAFEDPIGVFALDTSVTLNGVPYTNSEAAFFTPALGGGVDVCIKETCSPNPPTVAPRFVVFTNPVQLFTGTLEKPVFISGPVSVDQSQTFIEAPVPEPGPLGAVLLGGSILSVAFFKKQRESRLGSALTD